MKYPVAVAVLVTLTVVLSWVGLAWLGPLIFPPTVALWWVRGERGRAFGLVAAGGGAGLLVGITLGLGVPEGLVLGFMIAVFALLGLVLGKGFRDRVPYGRLLARVVAILYVIACFNVVLGGETLRANTRDMMEQSLHMAGQAPGAVAPADDEDDNAPKETPGEKTVEKPAETPAETVESPAGQANTSGIATGPESTGPDSADKTEYLAMVEDYGRWVVEHWYALVFGTTFIVSMWMALALVGLTEWTMRRGGVTTRPKGDLRGLRVPDWVVWLAIAATLLWALDRNYPQDTLRIVAWNGGIMLAGVYWLCGLSILFHTVTALRLPPMLVVLFLVLFFMAGNAQLLLCVIGLFDTWADFRGRLDRALARRRERNDDNHGP